jgi:ASPIC and UnbV/Secretion system C-terminal sorting domain/FG-GAP-like repeat
MKKLTVLFLFIFSCLNLNGQIMFQDVATSAGVGISFGTGYLGGGVSFCDFDNDGWDDLTLASESGQTVKVYKNNNGSFQLMDFGLNELYETKQVIWVDYDNDGDKDFFVVSNTQQNALYRNDGSNVFVNITPTSGLFTTNLLTFGASWGDFDNDGLLDIFISNRDDINFNQRNYLYKNNGDDTFTDVTFSSGIDLNNHVTFCSSFFDYDNDGDLDIYLANDRIDNPNVLYQNNGDSTFTDVSVISGTDLKMNAMSTTIDDYNNDEWLDIYVTNTANVVPGTTIGNALLQNNGDGTFTNIAVAAGVDFNSIGWGAVFLDADLNTYNDLYVSGMLDGSTSLPSAFYENDGDDTFTIPLSAGFTNDTSESYANAIGDFNNDGKPDIVVINETDNIFLWENQSITTNNWLKVKLQGTTSNRDGIGSKIEISINGQIQYRYTLCGEGYISQNSDTEIFGAGTATNIDYVKVTWLSGVVDILNNVTPNQTLTIVENSTLSSKEFDKNTFIIFPNPTSGIVNIKPTINQDFILTIFDAIGRKISSKAYKNINKSINVNDLSNGVYFFSFNTEKGEITKKVVIYE